MIKLGNICEVASGKALVKVNYQGAITKLIPYISPANSFMQSYTPPRVGEQVILLECESGNAKFALGAIFCQSYKEPSGASDTKQITTYEDGTVISYDTLNSTLEVLNPETININVKNGINITCKNANLTALNTTIKSPTVLIDGNTTIQGAISTSGGGGASGTFSIKGDVTINGNLTTTGNITDARGDLTGHSHSDTDGYISTPR